MSNTKNNIMEFYGNDFEIDTAALSASATGVWIRMLIFMSNKRNATISGSFEQIARNVRCTENEIKNAIQEFKSNNICNINLVNSDDNIFSVTCRRLDREYNGPDFQLSESEILVKKKVTKEKTDLNLKEKATVVAEKKLSFSYDGDQKFHGIDDEMIKKWKETFPTLDIEHEIKKAELWLSRNSNKRKKYFMLFLDKWFNRTEEHDKIIAAVCKNAPQKRKDFNHGDILSSNPADFSRDDTKFIIPEVAEI